jgi:hypothetical protein
LTVIPVSKQIDNYTADGVAISPTTPKVNEAVNQFKISFETEPGASYNVYYRTIGGANLETYDHDGRSIPAGEYINTGLTATGTALDDGLVQLLWTPPAQRQGYQIKVVGALAGHLPHEEATSSTVSARNAIVPDVPVLVGRHTANYGSYYQFDKTSFYNGLLPGESIQIWGTKTTTTNATLQTNTATHSELLYTVTTTTDIPAVATNGGITYNGTSYYFNVGGTLTTTVTADNFDFVIVAK